ncbi:unnamed protein product [Cuscuta campestris]|uniref:Retrotransposon gag domain-containing protein n=1 Tax=Cuscuta campestris TaxID=132261 RepID=A0A484M5C9_9ASTE|nr:unnamed protein product [Cuscuta campestris]
MKRKIYLRRKAALERDDPEETFSIDSANSGDMTLPEYRQKFTKLAKFAPTLVNTPTDRIEEFRKKLRPDLRSRVFVLTTVDFAEAYDLIARADSDLSACIEYLKTNNVSSSTHRPTGSASKGKRPFQEPSNSHFSKKGKPVQTQSMASVDKSKKRRYPACEHCGRNHPGECWLKQDCVSAVENKDTLERSALQTPENRIHLPLLLVKQHRHDLHQVNAQQRGLIQPKIRTNNKDELLLVHMQ